MAHHSTTTMSMDMGNDTMDPMMMHMMQVKTNHFFVKDELFRFKESIIST